MNANLVALKSPSSFGVVEQKAIAGVAYEVYTYLVVDHLPYLVCAN